MKLILKSNTNFQGGEVKVVDTCCNLDGKPNLENHDHITFMILSKVVKTSSYPFMAIFLNSCKPFRKLEAYENTYFAEQQILGLYGVSLESIT